MQIQIVSTCLPTKNKKNTIANNRAQHHIRGGNSTTFSFKGISGTYPRQITAIMCHVIAYATPRCVAENFAKLLKIMRNYTVSP